LTALGKDLAALAATIGGALFLGPDIASTIPSDAGTRRAHRSAAIHASEPGE